MWQHEPGADAARRAYRAKQIGRFVALIAWCSRPAAAICPDASEAALLTHACFVLPPQLDRLALLRWRNGGSNQVGEVRFMRLLCRHIGLRMAWPNRNVAEGQSLQDPPDAALVQRCEETRHDPVPQIA